MAFLSDFGAPIFGVLSVSVAFFALFYRCFTVLAERFYFGEFCGRGLLFLRFGGAESLNFTCFRALTSIFMRASMHRGAVLTSEMRIYFRSQVRRCLKTNKQGEFNLLLREVCRVDLKTRTQR